MAQFEFALALLRASKERGFHRLEIYRSWGMIRFIKNITVYGCLDGSGVIRLKLL